MSLGEAPPLDESRIFEAFARHGVDYVLVGGLGARLHGATRFTFDFDARSQRSAPQGQRTGRAGSPWRTAGD